MAPSLSLASLAALGLSFGSLALAATVSPNGQCGPPNGYTCQGSNFGNSCGKYNTCGRDPSYSELSRGCQPAYGFCYPKGSVSPDGTCGGSDMFNCQGSAFGRCCGRNNRCGGDDGYCAAGCQPLFGYCNICTTTAVPSTTTITSTISTTITTTTPVVISTTITSGTTTTTSASTATRVVPACTGGVSETNRNINDQTCGPITGYNRQLLDTSINGSPTCRGICSADQNCNSYIYRNENSAGAYCYTTSRIVAYSNSVGCPSGGSISVSYVAGGSRSPPCVNGVNQQESSAALLFRRVLTSEAPVPSNCGAVTTVGYTTVTVMTTTTAISSSQVTSTSFTTVATVAYLTATVSTTLTTTSSSTQAPGSSSVA